MVKFCHSNFREKSPRETEQGYLCAVQRSRYRKISIISRTSWVRELELSLDLNDKLFSHNFLLASGSIVHGDFEVVAVLFLVAPFTNYLHFLLSSTLSFLLNVIHIFSLFSNMCCSLKIHLFSIYIYYMKNIMEVNCFNLPIYFM